MQVLETDSNQTRENDTVSGEVFTLPGKYMAPKLDFEKLQEILRIIIINMGDSNINFEEKGGSNSLIFSVGIFSCPLFQQGILN